MSSVQEWYRDWFGEDYLLVYPHRNVEAAAPAIGFIRDMLLPKSEELILDLACGEGVFGSFNGASLSCESNRLIVISRKE